MKYNPTQSAIAHNPFRSALRAGKNIQRPAKLAEAWGTYSSHSRNDTARPLATTIAPTTGRGLIPACSMLTIKSQKSIRKPYSARRRRVQTAVPYAGTDQLGSAIEWVISATSFQLFTLRALVCGARASRLEFACEEDQRSSDQAGAA